MLATILSWLSGSLFAQLTKAFEIHKNAQTEEQKQIAAVLIADIQKQIADRNAAAAVIKEGMQHKVFWIPWLIAAIPTALWFAWGMLDSLFNGALPDVAALPPQLKQYADVVFANIFYVGGGVKGAELIASAIRGRR